MKVLFLDTLKTISGYKDLRAVRAWLTRLQVPLQRIGKNYAVDKVVFEQHFEKKHALAVKRNTYVPIEESEKSFLLETSDLLSRDREL